MITEFLALADSSGRAAAAYREDPSPETLQRIAEYRARAERLFDLSLVPQTARSVVAADAATFMWEVLFRIELPPVEEIPDSAMMKTRIADGDPAQYTIPHTEIVLHRVEAGEREGEYLFSPSTVRRIRQFYNRVKKLPYTREMTIEHPRRIMVVWGGPHLMPPKRADALPDWLKAELGGQATWKWIAVVLVFVLVVAVVSFVHRLAMRISDRPSVSNSASRLAAPVVFLALTPLMHYLWLNQIGVTGLGAQFVQLAVPALTYIAMAWLAWRVPLFIAEAVIVSPAIPTKGLHANLLRLLMQVVGAAGVLVILFWGGERLGVPLYGLLAGVGVGGLAIALAAQGTLENFLGSINLFADHPVRVGDFCRYGHELGTVEEIGLRSTRIRGLDQTLTSIPNSDFSTMQVTNLSHGEKRLLHTMLGLRYDTSPEQLRFVLAKLRELLLAHPMVETESSHVRFAEFASDRLNLECVAYVNTADGEEYLKIQEDIYLRMLEIVADAGTRLALPSQTLYLTRDSGLDTERAARALAEVQAWRREHKLPFPDFDVTFRKEHQDTLDYPPEGSATPEPAVPPEEK